MITTKMIIMSKVKQIIELLDTDRKGDGVVYKYVTPEMHEDAPARTSEVDKYDLIRYIIDFELAEDDELAGDLLQDAFSDVVDRYWDDIQFPTLLQNYLDAMAYMESFISKCHKPLSKADSDAMRKNMVAQFGISFGREAA
ncbi:hypothetical protein D3C87_1667550 [compost metagenome]